MSVEENDGIVRDGSLTVDQNGQPTAPQVEPERPMAAVNAELPRETGLRETIRRVTAERPEQLHLVTTELLTVQQKAADLANALRGFPHQIHDDITASFARVLETL